MPVKRRRLLTTPLAKQRPHTDGRCVFRHVACHRAASDDSTRRMPVCQAVGSDDRAASGPCHRVALCRCTHQPDRSFLLRALSWFWMGRVESSRTRVRKAKASALEPHREEPPFDASSSDVRVPRLCAAVMRFSSAVRRV